MKKSEKGIRKLVSELESDKAEYIELYSKWELINKKIGSIEPDEFDWAALGYTIHNIYNLLENYFLRVANFFENEVNPDGWHKDLVRRMALEIEGIRPALIEKDDIPYFDELRSFRHVFRNIYQSRLDEEKLKLVSSKLPEVRERFFRRHERFIRQLREILRRLEK